MPTEATDVVTALASDLLYQLSTAGQELFHTNMLYWLLRETPSASAPVAACLGIDAPTNPEASIRREWHNFDLYVDTGTACRKLVLEKKLHSLPRAEQLQENYEKIPAAFRTNETVCVLLSLIEPAFKLPEPWIHLDYADLVRPLRDSAAILRRGPDHRVTLEADLLDRYAQLVENLVALRVQYSIRAELDQPARLNDTERQRLQDARVLPLVEKLRIADLATLVTQRNSNKFRIDIGYSNGTGIAQFFIEGSSGHTFAWQYQAGQMRLAVVLKKTDDRSWVNRRPERERFVQQQFSGFFEFEAALPIDASKLLGDYTGRRLPWLSYEPDFVYKYRPLQTGVTYSQLADICTQLSSHVQRYAAAH